LGRERARIVVFAQHAEQAAQVGERLAAGVLDVEDRVACPVGIAASISRAPPPGRPSR
jgi:hypothetical protein